MNRRQLLTGLISLVAAPVIVRAASIMPVRKMLFEGEDITFTVTSTYQQLIAGLKADGVWDKLDSLYIFKAPDEETALINHIRLAPGDLIRIDPNLHEEL